MTLFINGKTYEAGELVAYVEKLEKENAELKKKNLDTQDAVTMQMYTNKANKEVADRQLTKAKDIIKKFLLWENDWHDKTESKYELLKEAEQFLKELDK